MQTYRSRWGWHPCDYATFLQLKRLFKAFHEGRRRLAAWKRWACKLPHNRVPLEPRVAEIHRVLCESGGRKATFDIVAAYQNARHGRPEDEVKPLGISAATIERWCALLADSDGK